MDREQTNVRLMDSKSFRIWQQLKKLPQQVGVALCLCFTQPSCIINGSYHFPLQHVLQMVARQMADLLQQCKSYMFLKEGKIYGTKGLAASYECVFFLL